MKFTPAKDWIAETFEKGVNQRTVRAWVENKLIPGVILDDRVFVDADKASILLDTQVIITPEDGTQRTPTGANIASIVQGAFTQ